MHRRSFNPSFFNKRIRELEIDTGYFIYTFPSLCSVLIRRWEILMSFSFLNNGKDDLHYKIQPSQLPIQKREIDRCSIFHHHYSSSSLMGTSLYAFIGFSLSFFHMSCSTIRYTSQEYINSNISSYTWVPSILFCSYEHPK